MFGFSKPKSSTKLSYPSEGIIVRTKHWQNGGNQSLFDYEKDGEKMKKTRVSEASDAYLVEKTDPNSKHKSNTSIIVQKVKWLFTKVALNVDISSWEGLNIIV